MTQENKAPSQQGQPGGDRKPDSNAEMDTLRRLLLQDQIQKIEVLETEVDHLSHQIADKKSMIRLIAPVLAESIRQNIRDAREEIIEALYPIIGQIVGRAVSESVRDLARSLNAQAKRSFDIRAIWWRVRARFGGASDAQIRLREMLPFEATDIFVIHRESGLLLFHISNQVSGKSNTDLISGMLTAIRDFARDTLESQPDSDLGEIQYGDQRILIETAQKAYIAVMIRGIEPLSFREAMRETIIRFNNSNFDELSNYQGEAEIFLSEQPNFKSLLDHSQEQTLTPTQKRILIGVTGITSVFIIAFCLFANWFVQVSQALSVPEPTEFQPTLTSTSTVTPLPTLTPTPSLTSTPTIQPSPTATLYPLPSPVFGVTIGNLWLRAEPSEYGNRVGLVLNPGTQVEILSRYGNWYQIRYAPPGDIQVTGWISSRWVTVVGTLPPEIITPTPIP